MVRGKITVYVVILSLILGKVANRLCIAFILMVRYEFSGFREQATVASRHLYESGISVLLDFLGILNSRFVNAGRLKRAGQESLSHETIYQMIYQNYRDCGEHQEYLGGQTRKKKESKRGEK
ncbi:MAG: hypothetical protein IM326_01300 [Microcystis sp. M020S1]|nr:hypothetical protein [Microcystis sp. M020S1]